MCDDTCHATVLAIGMYETFELRVFVWVLSGTGNNFCVPVALIFGPVNQFRGLIPPQFFENGGLAPKRAPIVHDRSNSCRICGAISLSRVFARISLICSDLRHRDAREFAGKILELVLMRKISIVENNDRFSCPGFPDHELHMCVIVLLPSIIAETACDEVHASPRKYLTTILS
jgi:hypothetical protein